MAKLRLGPRYPLLQWAVLLGLALCLLGNLPASAAVPSAPPGPVVYVNLAALGANNGTSWADAYTDLALALEETRTNIEIWVARGTYRPSPGTDRSAAFVLRSAIAVYGGFTGTETVRSQRDWRANPTVLSGDIGAVGSTGDNSYHVVMADTVDATAKLDGFTIRDGQADGIGNAARGGGMFCMTAQPTLQNIVFTRNYAQGAAQYAGGALFNYDCMATLRNVAFISNEAQLSGGAVINFSGGSTFANVVFYNNVTSSPTAGGTAVVNLSTATPPTFINVTIAGNRGGSDSEAMLNDASNPVIRNSIIWGNVPALHPLDNRNGAVPDIAYTIIDADYVRDGNLNVDPLLRSISTGDLNLAPLSPAVDSGLDAFLPADATDLDGDANLAEALPLDLNGLSRILSAHVDRGAYEGAPDIAVTKTVYPIAVRVGEWVTYTLAVKNAGALTATSVAVTDTLSSAMSEPSFSTSGLPFVYQQGSTYSWTVTGDVAPGQAGTILITARVPLEVASNLTIRNEAMATAALDLGLANNRALVEHVVDNEPPLPPTLSSPADGALLNDNTPLLTWLASPSTDVVAHSVDLDGTLYSTGSGTSYTAPTLADGAHTWTVAAVDRVAFVSTYPPTRTFTIDSTPPETLLTQTPVSPTIEITATFAFTATDLGSGLAGFQCKLDTATWLACTSPVTTPLLLDGIHTFSVRALDIAGNTDPTPAVASWRIDTMPPPAPVLLSPPNNAVTRTVPLTLTWSPLADAAAYVLMLDGSSSDVGLTTQASTGLLADGVYTWTVWAYDLLGHVGPSAPPYTFTLDLTPPAVPTLVSPVDGAALLDRVLELQWNAVTGASGYLLDLDGAVRDVGNSLTALTATLPIGPHTWTVAAYDALGNISAYAQAWHFEIELHTIFVPLVLRAQP